MWFDLSKDDFLRKWYEEEYTRSAYGAGPDRVQQLMHRSIEKPYTKSHHFKKVLEVGGNVGEHLKFVKHTWDEYVLTDLFDSFSIEDKHELLSRKIRFEIADVQSLQFETSSFDRVVTTCVLHHVTDAETSLLELRRVTKPGGTLDIFLSADPGMLFRFARWIGPYRKAKKIKLGNVKKLVDARDHINHAGGLRTLITHTFRDDDVVELTYPIRCMTWNSSLWMIFRVRKNEDV